MESSTFEKRKLMFMSSVALGGCGIWSMHFVGMNALQLTADGVKLEMYFEPVLTFFSMFLSVVAVFCGLLIASTDSFFVEIQEDRTFIVNNCAGKEWMRLRKKMQVRILWLVEMKQSYYFVVHCHV